MIDNTKKLFHVNNDHDTFACLNGIRLFSMVLVIAYHSYQWSLTTQWFSGQYINYITYLVHFKYVYTVLVNHLDAMNFGGSLYLQLISNALMLDTFFLLSGFLNCFLIIKKFKNSSQKSLNPLINLIHRFIHRFIRITPTMLAMIAISILMEVLGSGPHWHRYVEESRNTCHTNWWANILYINNIVNLVSIDKEQGHLEQDQLV